MVKAEEFTHILRVQNTNVDGKRKAAFAINSIKGIGRRFANLVLKIAQIDLTKRAGELVEADIEKINDILAKPTGRSPFPPIDTLEFRLQHPQVVP